MSKIIQIIVFIITLLVPTTINAQSSNQLKLSVNPEGILDMFDIQDASLEQLEMQFNMMQSQIASLEKYNEELKLQINDANKYILDLQTSLETARANNAAQLEYQKSLESRLADANHKYKAASIAGPIAGILVGAGTALLIYGAVEKNNPMLYTGLGLAGGTIIVWTTGKLAFEWW